MWVSSSSNANIPPTIEKQLNIMYGTHDAGMRRKYGADIAPILADIDPVDVPIARTVVGYNSHTYTLY